MSKSENTNVNKYKLLFIKFLYSAHLKTYAGTDLERKKTKCQRPKLPKHKEYCYSEKDWEYLDSYAGHIFPQGKEVVYYKKKPFWLLSCQVFPRLSLLPLSFL